MIPFVNLHRHSKWSLLDGSGSGDQYAARAVELGQGSLAITDHGTLAGCLEHFQTCRDQRIFPIMGVEVYFRENRLDHTKIDGVDKNGKKIKKHPKRFHLTLLAMNYTGWVNLQRITSEAYRTGLTDFADKPCVDWDLLSRHSEGIYCLGGCFAGILAQDILAGGMYVNRIIQNFRSLFKENFSLEIMPHDWETQTILNIDTINVANQNGIPLTVTGDTHYPYVEWASTQDVLIMMKMKQTKLKRAQKDLDGEEYFSMHKENPTLHLMSGDEMFSTFQKFHPNIPPDLVTSAIKHTTEIVSKFEPFLLDRAIKMPRFSREVLSKIDPINAFDDADPDEIVKKTLRRWALAGLDDLKKLYPASHWEKFPIQQYINQVEHELDTFDAVGIHSWRYMLMVGGEIRFARSQGVVVGPGRGSAAGSTIAYLIGITDIDPIPYDLMFERFINRNRKGMPDIDIDFMPGKFGRDLVEKHTGEVYDEGNVQNVIKIAAYGTYGPKAALRGVCRVFDDIIDYSTTDKYVKVLDGLKATDKLSLEECAERFPEIAEFKKRFPQLWTQACRIQGAPYTQSVHASGVLVKPTNVEVPTARKLDKDKGTAITTTAWPDTRELLAGYGFLKIDYLVIEGLVRQYNILKALRERDNSPIDLRTLPVRWDPYAVDPEVMAMLSKGMTLGVWQFEGRGTIPVLKAIRPTDMHDIAAVNALIRPGPRGAGMTEMYAKRKHGVEPITYWHDSVEPVLKKTMGLMIYQEQMMEIAVQLGDFDRSEADDLRKAMGKKYREGLAAVIKFLDDLGFGTKFKHNAALKVGEEMAVDIWEKRMLPFGEYSFNASHAYAYGLISYHDTLLKKLSPADFFASYLTGTEAKELPAKIASVRREGSRFGLAIKPPDINRSGYGFTVLDRQTVFYGMESVKGVGPAGVQAIFQNRPFESYRDFDARIPKKPLNKNARKSLVGAGAFDTFGLRSMLTEEERAQNELEHIGMRLSGTSDLEKYGDLIEDSIHSEEEVDALPHKEYVCVGGEIIGIKPTVTKAKGEAMGFITVAFGADTYRVTLFHKNWMTYMGLFEIGKVVIFQGRKDISDQYGHGVIAEEAISLEDFIYQKQAEVLT